jgi:hypothetical protein
MARFREFLLKEDIGLGDLGVKLDRFYNDPALNARIGGAFASTAVTGTGSVPGLGYGGHSLNLPTTDLTIPSMEKTGRITTLLLKRNPIYIRLSDGTEANFTYDEYRRIEGKPELGKVMTIIFQRHPEDRAAQASKIDKAIVS